MWPELPRPIVFAHRGASAHAPENTLAAFCLAAEQGAPAIELDAKLSRDGEVVVFHDPTLRRTTGAEGALASRSLAELKTLDAGSFFDARFAGEPIPTLTEVFEAVGQRVFINVELTNYTTPDDGLVPAVVDLVRRMGLAGRVLFSSFDPRNLAQARALLPEVPVGLLALQGRAGWLSRVVMARLLKPAALHPYFSDVSARSVAREHRAGRRVHAWTVNDPQTMRRLRDAGVDGVFTDDPALARTVLFG